MTGGHGFPSLRPATFDRKGQVAGTCIPWDLKLGQWDPMKLPLVGRVREGVVDEGVMGREALGLGAG